VSITLTDVGQRFNAQPWLFRHLTATLESGHVYALTGPSGSGKSTLLSILAGWEPPTEGRVVFDSAANTAWVFQNPHGSPRRAAVDHVALPLLARGFTAADADRQANEILAQFGLAGLGRRQFAALSGGEAQRLMLARAVASAPDLLLVDEPTAQLDRRSADVVNASLCEIAQTGSIAVIATHDSRTRDVCTDELRLEDFRSDRLSDCS
jgi:lipoprotein-releasing system ATP-binding protein